MVFTTKCTRKYFVELISVDFKNPVIFTNNKKKTMKTWKLIKIIRKQMLLIYHYYFELGQRSKTIDSELIIKEPQFFMITDHQP